MAISLFTWKPAEYLGMILQTQFVTRLSRSWRTHWKIFALAFFQDSFIWNPSCDPWFLNFEKSWIKYSEIFREFSWFEFNQVYSIWFNEIRKDLNTYVSEPSNDTLNYLSLNWVWWKHLFILERKDVLEHIWQLIQNSS